MTGHRLLLPQIYALTFQQHHATVRYHRAEQMINGDPGSPGNGLGSPQNLAWGPEGPLVFSSIL